MPTSPQSITRRYASNLLRDGRNNDFEIHTVQRILHTTELGHVVGAYFQVSIKTLGAVVSGVVADGATPQAALENALTKAGVTFR